MAINIELLRKVQRGILKEPKRYKQEIWGVSLNGDASCNTAGCIAGWAYAIDEELLDGLDKLRRRYKKATGGLPQLAQKALGLNFVKRTKLFHVEEWPIIFWPFIVPNSEELRGPRWLQALIAAIRIEVFIQSNGKL